MRLFRPMFHPMDHEPGQSPMNSRTNPWAIASFLSGLGFWCLPFACLSPWMGLRALKQINEQTGLPGGKVKGKGLARGGIGLGFVGIAVYIAFGWWWSATIRPFYLYGPREAIMAGQIGDMEAFRHAFRDVGDVDDAAGFLGMLRERYGLLLAVQQDAEAQRTVANEDYRHPVLAYQLEFERGTVAADCRLFMENYFRADERKLEVLTIHDPLRGDLTYPVGATIPPPPDPDEADHAESDS